MCSGGGEDSHGDLHYIRRRYITKEHMRAAIAKVCNAIFQVRNPDIWGEATTACASDSKKFGAWDQNLMTEWHVRYGGRGSDDLLACGKALRMHLLTAQNLLVVRGLGDG